MLRGGRGTSRDGRSALRSCASGCSAERMIYPYLTGGVAQLGEHLLCKQGVVGSIPSASTKDFWSSEIKNIIY